MGMAEQHAVTFAAGLASQGMLPVVCIYSTFLQRSYDQILHDVNLLQENVVFAIDRAGFVPADGETHQGVYDPAFLSQIGMPLYAPSNYAELTYWLHELLKDGCRGPVRSVIRGVGKMLVWRSMAAADRTMISCTEPRAPRRC